MSMPGLLVIMGSGETAPTMIKIHRSIFERVGDRPAVVLDTPYGFQSNADEISTRAAGYFRASVGRRVEVLSWRTAPPPGLDRERAMARLSSAGWIFAGPGSPTYALRHWRDTPVQTAFAKIIADDGVAVLASAAALTLGSHTVPVYEIYKAGFEPAWQPGLNLMRQVCGLPAVVIPHYDNAEGGHHDTRYCYLGEQRLALLERALPESSFVLGVDEHTAVLLDPGERTATVLGRGTMTIRRAGRSVVHPSGSVVDFTALASVPGPSPRSPALVRPRMPPAGATGSVGVTGSATPVGVAGSAPAAPSLGGATAEASARFQAGLDRRDVAECVEAILELERSILDWSADTLTSDEGDRARSQLRAMVVRLGELATGGARDPREIVGPFIEGLLEVRSRARHARDWDSADLVRERLAAAGVEVRDTPTGVEWHLR